MSANPIDLTPRDDAVAVAGATAFDTAPPRPRRRFSLLGTLLGAPKVATLFGIEVRVHALFVLLFASLVFQTWRDDGADAALITTFHFLALFACVLLHELGHSLMAKRHGVKVHDILLWPLGGVARIERIPDSTRIELQIALAGPAVNFVLLCLIVPIARLAGQDPFAIDPELEFIPFVQWLVLVNLAMGVFNLLPAFPMDGGRVLRALLALRIDSLRATCVAVGIGRMIALCAIVIGVSEPEWLSLAIVGAFVWIAGGIELRNTLRRAQLVRASRLPA